MKRLYIFALICISNLPLFAQSSTGSVYDPHALFAPNFYPVGSTVTRSADGSPNAGYWQNRVDYQLAVSLNDETNEIKGSVTITYKNNSPLALQFLWLQLDQNLFNKDSRGQARMPVGSRSRYGDAKSNFDGGFKISSVKIVGESSDANYVVNDTRMQIRLPKALKAAGDHIKFKIDYSFTLPKYGADRCGIMPSRNGDVYAVAQWYPRMCVYDDVLGWNTNPYLGPSEFYCEYGDFEMSITAPSNHIVVASGELTNPTEVLSPEFIKRLNQAKQSDQTVMIRSGSELNTPAIKTASKTLTWKFKMTNSRDVAWSSSKAFVWDAARINLSNGKKALAQSVYPLEFGGNSGWGRSTEYTKYSIENYSKRWLDYPYPVATNVASNIGGMEYPGIVFCGANAQNADLFGVTDHEFGHTWFPMIVGSNERKYGWMDEGLNTFINGIAAKDFNKGEYDVPMHSMELQARNLFGAGSEGIMFTPDAMLERNIGNALYFKPGYGLDLLRKYILGEDRFDFAFKTYIDRWAYKHPTPWDFFRTMDNAAGEDLSWFWKGWFVENYSLDQAIESVSYDGNKPSNGAIVTLVNNQKMAMPVVLSYVTKSGIQGTKMLPVEIWNNTSNFRVKLNTTEELASVTIDPDKQFPDINPNNNRWTP